MPASSSTRQPFIAQSTAEAELLAYNESLQTAEALIVLLKVFEREVIGGLLGDSKSAMSQLALRTRHLRLRSAKLREVLQYPKKWWVQHVPGSTLVADGLTKPLQGQQFMRYRQMLNLRPGDECGEKKKIARLEARQESKKDDWKTLAHGLCVGGLALVLRGDTKAGCLLMLAAAG